MRAWMKRSLSLAVAAVTLSVSAAYSQTPDPCPADLASESLDGRVRYAACLAGSAAVGEVLSRAIALEIATAPFGSTSGGFTFTFDPATRIWNRTATTFGPAFSERALTSGRGKVSAGVNVLRRDYDSFAGQDLNRLEVARLQGATPPAVSTILDIGLRTETLAVFGHVGVTDNFDVGVAVPLVRVQINGLSRAFRPGGGEFPFEALQARSSGVGDIALIGKYRFWQPVGGAASGAGLAALVIVRVPTGNEANLRGLGITRTLASLVGSGTFGRVSPHVTAGYEFWSQGISIPTNFLENETVDAKDQVVYSAGVEVEVHPLLTANVDVLGRYLRGAGRVGTQEFRYAPASNQFGITSATVLAASGQGLNTLTIAPGFKLNLWGGALLSAHALITPSGNGLRDRITPVVGLDWTFALPTVGRAQP